MEPAVSKAFCVPGAKKRPWGGFGGPNTKKPNNNALLVRNAHGVLLIYQE